MCSSLKKPFFPGGFEGVQEFSTVLFLSEGRPLTDRLGSHQVASLLVAWLEGTPD